MTRARHDEAPIGDAQHFSDPKCRRPLKDAAGKTSCKSHRAAYAPPVEQNSDRPYQGSRSDSPYSASCRLISLSEVCPKFLMDSNSGSLRMASSPSVVMPSR